MAINYRNKPIFKSKNEEIIARLRAEAGADAPRDPVMMVKKKTAELAYLMALAHGGDWRVQIDHEVGLIVVARRCRRPKRSP